MPRTNYFIDKTLQMSFVYKFIILVLLEAAFILGLFLYISNDTLTTGYYGSVLTVERTADFFLPPLLIILSIVAIGVSIVGMIAFILVSHRIAGPIYRFKDDLDDVNKGDLTKRIETRKTDQLSDLKDTLNTLIDTFDERIGRIKTGLAELKTILSKDLQADQNKKIRDAVEALERETRQFKVSSKPKG